MALYRIHKLKDQSRQQFRWLPHTIGVSQAKPRDYDPGGSIDACGFYAAWLSLRGTESELGVGDILESDTGDLRICKYVGFEEVRWHVPDPKPGPEAAVGAAVALETPSAFGESNG
jgi:hypothetical protein